ncbi:cytochrome c family protein [Citreicella sp. C3M06]|uniref:c-type cytochrome n=1 Tax=Roseobacteraceae TaxID=2854170 RepID=UPI001C08FE4F|nr:MULTISPECIES: cytochrome c family protein [Roseobacteraceae]MBU2962552.1 cytochrome c family protein [Citreicella sp. C3M06]MDO6585396.1 cytochrome c family protein [Salipiger sp. 1_MG-2023]
MFDTMTMTKAVGGACGALLVYLLGSWVGESLYSMGGHGEEHAAAYVIDTGSEGGGAEEEAPVDFATLMASADAGAGEKVFGKCRACHKVDGSNATGPHLDGVVSRPVNAVDGFNYSGALLQVGDTWTPENLFNFLESPKAAAPGTTMSFAGLRKPEDRVNLIAYLDGLDG